MKCTCWHILTYHLWEFQVTTTTKNNRSSLLEFFSELKLIWTGHKETDWRCLGKKWFALLKWQNQVPDFTPLWPWRARLESGNLGWPLSILLTYFQHFMTATQRCGVSGISEEGLYKPVPITYTKSCFILMLRSSTTVPRWGIQNGQAALLSFSPLKICPRALPSRTTIKSKLWKKSKKLFWIVQFLSSLHAFHILSWTAQQLSWSRAPLKHASGNRLQHHLGMLSLCSCSVTDLLDNSSNANNKLSSLLG